MKKSRPEFSQLVHVEQSKSRTGRHAYARLAFVMDHNARVVAEVKPSKPTSEPLYKKGMAEEREVSYSTSQVLVVLEIKKNFKGRLEGKAEVYDHGDLVYRAVYRKLKLRGSYGDPSYSVFVESLFKHLGLKVKRVNPDAHLSGYRRGDARHKGGN